LLSVDNASVINWIDSSRGNPPTDVARTSVILLGSANSSQTKNFLDKIIVKTFHNMYLHIYFRLNPNGTEEYQYWIPLVAGARLTEANARTRKLAGESGRDDTTLVVFETHNYNKFKFQPKEIDK